MKNLRNVSALGCVLIVFTIATPGLGVEENGLLTPEDVSYEATDRENGPALSSSLDDSSSWASYNQWMCFDVSQIRIETSNVKFASGWKPWPQFSVETSGQRFVFSPETERELDASLISSSWKTLVSKTRNICLYAAFLQCLDRENMSESESLWILEGFKTESGYWRMADEISSQDGTQESSDEDEIVTE